MAKTAKMAKNAKATNVKSAKATNAAKVAKTIAYLLMITTFVCATFALVQYLLSFPAKFAHFTLGLSATLTQALFSLLSYAITLLIIIFIPKLINKKWRVSKEDLGLNELPTWLDLGLAPVGFIVYLVLAAILTSIFAAIFPWFDMSQAQDVGFNSAILGPDRILAFTALVVVSPIAEELVFRGFLYNKLKTSLSTKKRRELAAIIIATIITSLAFGIMHGQWNVGVNVFAMSLVLCAMREITGSIYASILLHMIKNAIAFYLLYVTTFNF